MLVSSGARAHAGRMKISCSRMNWTILGSVKIVGESQVPKHASIMVRANSAILTLIVQIPSRGGQEDALKAPA